MREAARPRRLHDRHRALHTSFLPRVAGPEDPASPTTAGKISETQRIPRSVLKGGRRAPSDGTDQEDRLFPGTGQAKPGRTARNGTDPVPGGHEAMTDAKILKKGEAR
jgi:hypothetical protein